MKIQEYGTEGKADILCIPGLFMSGECFLEVIAQLPEYHFVCITLNSHYPNSEGYIGREHELDLLTDMLRERGQTHFDLCIGLSLGTILSVCLAQRSEIKLDRLLLDGAVNFYRSKLGGLERAAMRYLFRSAMKQAREQEVYKPILDREYVGDWSKYNKVCAASMTDDALEIIIQELSAFEPESGLTQPMRFLYGSKEHNTAACSKNIRRCFPQAKIEKKEGYAHLIFLNRNPDKYAAIVRETLEIPVERKPIR